MQRRAGLKEINNTNPHAPARPSPAGQESGLPSQGVREEPSCVCGSSKLAQKVVVARDPVTAEVFTYVKCGHCGTERISPRPGSADIGRYYPSTYYAHSVSGSLAVPPAPLLKRILYFLFFAPANERPAAFAALRLLLYPVLFPIRHRTPVCFTPPAIRRVFEFGAARGDDLCFFRHMGWEVAGCEPSSAACEVARSRGILLECAAAEEAKVQESRYSCILLNNVFEHVHDPAQVLAKCHAGLVDDGVLILIVPNHASVSAALFGAAWPGYDAPRHLWGFTTGSMRQILRESGFTVETISHQAPTAWCWKTVLEGGGSPSAVGKLRQFMAARLPAVMLPLGIIFSLMGRGDFIRVIARKRPVR